jgi:hypothetical protein
VEEFPNHHRPLNEHLDLAAILCHVEQRVIGNDYTFSFRRPALSDPAPGGGSRDAASAAARRIPARWRVEGAVSGRYPEIGVCDGTSIAAQPKPARPVRKDHNAGGRSRWMNGFFDRPSPPLWKCVEG